MGNMGGIEKLMVFGILLIIITILGIAFFSASGEDEEYGDGNTDEVSIDSYYREDVTAKTTEPMPENVPVDPGSDTSPEGMGQPALKRSVNVEEPADLAQDSTGSAFPPAEDTTPQQPAGPRKYIVKKGDSFARIARVELGDEKWTTELIKANPDCDPLNLKVGAEIVLPDVSGLAAAKPAESKETGLVKMRTSSDVYIVKENDTLYRIATRVLGSKRHWKKLYEANRDILLDPNSLIPGMELRIPEVN